MEKSFELFSGDLEVNMTSTRENETKKNAGQCEEPKIYSIWAFVTFKLKKFCGYF